MKKYNLTLVSLLLVVGCGSSGEAEGEGQGIASAPEQPGTAAAPGPSDAKLAAPAADELSSYAARRAAVAETVGENMADRVMARADQQALPVYRLELANGNRIDFYEPLAGFAAAAEVGSAASTLGPEVLSATLTPKDVYRMLVPGSSVPYELEALTARQREMAPVYAKLNAARQRFANVQLPSLEPLEPESVTQAEPISIQPSLGAQERVGRLEQLLTGNECIAKSSGCNGALPFPWRIVHVDKTQDAKILKSDRLEVRGVGCTTTGKVTYRVRYQTWWTWTQWFAYDMTAGVFTQPWTFGQSLDFDFESRLYNFQAGSKASQCAGGR
jgi:hypothetical protein